MSVFFPTDTPNAPAKLGDRRRIPLLIDTIDKSIQEKNDHSNSSDDMFCAGFGGTKALIVKCCLAETSFVGKKGN